MAIVPSVASHDSISHDMFVTEGEIKDKDARAHTHTHIYIHTHTDTRSHIHAFILRNKSTDAHMWVLRQATHTIKIK